MKTLTTMKYLLALLFAAFFTSCGGADSPEPQRSPYLDVTFTDFVGKWTSPKVEQTLQFLNIGGSESVIFVRQNSNYDPSNLTSERLLTDTLNVTFEKLQFSINTHPNVKFFYNTNSYQADYIIVNDSDVKLQFGSFDYFKQ